MCKDVFVEGHERPDVVEDQNRFLTKMEELKSYMVEFNEDGVMKAKDYPVHCAMRGEEYISLQTRMQIDRKVNKKES